MGFAFQIFVMWKSEPTTMVERQVFHCVAFFVLSTLFCILINVAKVYIANIKLDVDVCIASFVIFV